MKRSVKIINSIVLCIWFFLLGTLLYKDHTGETLERSESLRSSFTRETRWYDIYSGKTKIGFAITGFERVGDQIIVRHEREMRVFVGEKGKEREMLLVEKINCQATPSFTIKSFEYSSHLKGEKESVVKGEVEGTDIIFFLETSKARKTHKISTGGRDFYLLETLVPAIHEKHPAPNASLHSLLLNFETLSLNDVKITLEEIRPIKIGINIMSLFKYKIGDNLVWTTEKGIPVKEAFQSGVTLFSQTETVAKDAGSHILFDYTSLPFIKANRVLGDPESLKSLTIRISNFVLDKSFLENSTMAARNDILIITREGVEDIKKKTYRLPFGNAGFEEYLNPDEWVSSSYGPLETTGKIFANARKNDSFLFSHYLVGYLFNLIRTKPQFVLLNGANILESLSGDYLERSVMYASYARAAGLPTRLVGGLVYVNGYFYFHAWPEVWFDKWIPVDPTLAQFPADVTHIPLKEGTLKDIISIVDDLKNIKIEILEAS